MHLDAHSVTLSSEGHTGAQPQRTRTCVGSPAAVRAVSACSPAPPAARVWVCVALRPACCGAKHSASEEGRGATSRLVVALGAKYTEPPPAMSSPQNIFQTRAFSGLRTGLTLGALYWGVTFDWSKHNGGKPHVLEPVQQLVRELEDWAMGRPPRPPLRGTRSRGERGDQA